MPSKTVQVPVITLDGPSGTGKGTLCHMLANHLNWHVLDSGCVYRVLALAAEKEGIDFEDEQGLSTLALALHVTFKSDSEENVHVFLDGINIDDAIRTERCGQNASKIAVFSSVREALLNYQRSFAKPPGLVTDGRDMGTVVFPDAMLKLYVYASPEERASRRYLQLKNKGIDVSLAEVVDELALRDKRDTLRLHAPLKPAHDAVVIDTTGLTIIQVFDNVLKLVDCHVVKDRG